MYKVNTRNSRKRCGICSKLTIKTPERCNWRRSGVFIVSFEHYFTLFPWASIIDFKPVNFSWVSFGLKSFDLELKMNAKNSFCGGKCLELGKSKVINFVKIQTIVFLLNRKFNMFFNIIDNLLVLLCQVKFILKFYGQALITLSKEWFQK